jgi:hypothetical protein
MPQGIKPTGFRMVSPTWIGLRKRRNVIIVFS